MAGEASEFAAWEIDQGEHPHPSPEPATSKEDSHGLSKTCAHPLSPAAQVGAGQALGALSVLVLARLQPSPASLIFRLRALWLCSLRAQV